MKTDDRTLRLDALLDRLRETLVFMKLWEDEPPAPGAFESRLPFAADTMEFHQWLQWIFLPTLYVLMEKQQPLPSGSDVASMGEVWCQMRGLCGDRIVVVLREIDGCLQ